MSKKDALDPRSSQMYVTLRFEEENWTEDMSGSNGSDSKRSAQKLLAPFKKKHPRDAESMMQMHLEDVAANAIYDALKKKQNRAPNSLGRGSYDDYGLSVFIPVDTVKDVAKVRDLLDREGRSYNLAPYIEACDPILFPKGINGPVYGLDGSSVTRLTGDLDEWLEDHGA